MTLSCSLLKLRLLQGLSKDNLDVCLLIVIMRILLLYLLSLPLSKNIIRTQGLLSTLRDFRNNLGSGRKFCRYILIKNCVGLKGKLLVMRRDRSGSKWLNNPGTMNKN